MAITRRNYTPGQYETFTGEPVGTPVLNTPTAFKLDGLFSFDVADDVILIQGGSAIPTTAYELLTDNLYTAKEAGYSGLTVVKMFKITNAAYAGIATTASGKNFGSAVDNDILWGVTDIVNPTDRSISLTPGRKTFDELTSGILSTSGWYTIAETDLTVDDVYSGIITVSDKYTRNAVLVASFAGSGSVAATREIKILNHITYNSAIYSISGIRLAYSTTPGSGTKIQVELNIPSGSSQIGVLITNNNARAGTGMKLVTPYLDDTPTLPDGVTVGTFLEAGAEYDLTPGGGTYNFRWPFSVLKVNDNAINVNVIWPEVPKPGTSLSITLPATALVIFDGAGNSATITSAHAVGFFSQNGYSIKFRITEAGAFSSLNNGPLAFETRGSEGKVIIS